MDTGKCITNMITTRQGEHCMFRSFGLGHVTDRVGMLRRSDIVREIAKWYPNVRSVDVEMKGNGRIPGNSEYNVTVIGDE